MRTVGRDSIVEFRTHLERIAKAASHIHFEGNNDTKVKSDMACFTQVDTLRAKLVPLLKKGLETYYEKVDETTHTAHPSEAKVSVMVTYSLEVK